ncbi:MAG: NAD-dependent epimerase/dehydratase [Chloroflexi bacterium]|nr:NAD-dependent epimerase/dehydratase [Chloroflexota bacterium]
MLQELAASGQHEVTSFDRVAPAVEGVRWIRGETTDYGDVVSALQGAESVIHLAAYTMPYVQNSNHVLFSNNVVSTYNVFEAAALHGARRVVIASSGAILGWTYGRVPFLPKYMPIDEDHPLAPQDPYGLSKLCDEQIARSFSIRSGIETIAIRPSLVLFPEMSERLTKQGGQPIAKFGVYTHVDVRDLAQAFRLAAEVPHKGHVSLWVGADDSSANEPLSVGLPRVVPQLGDMASALDGEKPGISNRRSKEVLGWEQRYSWRRPD